MPESEARAWWADVEHLREDLARKRAERDDRPAFSRVAARPGGRFVRAQEAVATGAVAVAEPAGHAEALQRSRSARRAGRWHDLTTDATAASGSAQIVRLPARDERPRHQTASHDAEPRRTPSRRTVEIRGRAARARPAAEPSTAPPAYERRRYTPRERLADRPDRIAKWALIMAFALMALAIFTS